VVCFNRPAASRNFFNASKSGVASFFRALSLFPSILSSPLYLSLSLCIFSLSLSPSLSLARLYYFSFLNNPLWLTCTPVEWKTLVFPLELGIRRYWTERAATRCQLFCRLLKRLIPRPRGSGWPRRTCRYPCAPLGTRIDNGLYCPAQM
jgi:hypothetical protein